LAAARSKPFHHFSSLVLNASASLVFIMGSLIIITFLTLVTKAALAENVYDQFDPKQIGPFEGSYSQCILDKMPGVASDLAAGQIAQQCLRKYPEGIRTVESGSKLFGFDNGYACVAQKARDTVSRAAATMIARACFHRYGQTKPVD
jgi:hypothetical protein